MAAKIAIPGFKFTHRADIDELESLHKAGRLHAYHCGPTPEVAIAVCDSGVGVWEARLELYQVNGVEHFFLTGLEANSTTPGKVTARHFKDMVRLLGDHFYGCESLAVKIGQVDHSTGKEEPSSIEIMWA